MAYLFVPLALYASLVAQTALRFGGAGHWTPNLMLLVGLAASRGRGGVVWAAGAGNWSEPSTEALGTSTRKASTMATVPMKMPEAWARNCLRGLAPSR